MNPVEKIDQTPAFAPRSYNLHFACALFALAGIAVAFSLPYSREKICHFFSKTVPHAYEKSVIVDSVTAAALGFMLAFVPHCSSKKKEPQEDLWTREFDNLSPKQKAELKGGPLSDDDELFVLKPADLISDEPARIASPTAEDLDAEYAEMAEKYTEDLDAAYAEMAEEYTVEQIMAIPAELHKTMILQKKSDKEIVESALTGKEIIIYICDPQRIATIKDMDALVPFNCRVWS